MSTEMIPLFNTEKISVRIHTDGRCAIGITHPHKDKKFIIKEITLGVGIRRKSIPYSRYFLQANMECNAEIINGNKIRII